ncbi:MAG: PilT/PilU family type 4a pilus ATPase [Planctomycetes bacterium]|nr:PilT/PilU family type 4a pilus ATPase [Planctomycetota bacterium]
MTAFKDLFAAMIKENASDLFIKVGAPPAMRVTGKIKMIKGQSITTQMAERLFDDIVTERIRKIFEETGEVDAAYEIPDIGRFRTNIFKQRNALGFVFRHVRDDIPTMEKLNLPVKQLHKLSKTDRGLVLVTGTAGSGKSTCIASMIDYINKNERKHIVTIEDPIEYIFKDQQSILDQRELGIDTQSFSSALKHCVRQSPDIIMIGEMRDQETMQAAFNAAETGHMVISTLHTINSYQTVERIINFFPPHQHRLLQEQLALLLAGVVSLRLIPTKDGKTLVPAAEILINSPTIKETLYQGKVKELYKSVKEGSYYGSQTFNQALKEMVLNDIITAEEALAAADNPDELKMELRGIMRSNKPGDFDFKVK